VSQNCRLGGTLKYIWFLLVKDQKFNFVILRGAGQAIANVVALTQLIRSKIPNLYTLTEITTITEPYKSKDQTRERNIIMLKVTLTLDENQLDSSLIGY
jgi:DNA-binding protein